MVAMLGTIACGDIFPGVGRPKGTLKSHRLGWLLKQLHRYARPSPLLIMPGDFAILRLPTGCPQSDETVSNMISREQQFVMLRFPPWALRCSPNLEFL